MAKKILIVEDTIHLRNQIVEILEMEGYEIFTASNGKDALEMMTRFTPELIITDLLMPEINGFDLISIVRRNAMLNAVQILVFSAMPSQESKNKVLSMGANYYLKKPSPLELLVEAVKKLIVE